MSRQFSIKRGLFFIAGMQFCLVLTFLIFSFFMNFYQHYNDTSNRYFQVGEQMLVNTRISINRLEQATLFPTQLYAQNNDSYICRTLREDKVLKNFRFYSYFDTHARTKLTSESTDFIGVYDLKGNGVATSRGSSAYYICFLDGTPSWIEKLAQYKIGTSILIPSQEFEGSGLYNKDKRSVCSARGVLDLNSIKIVGYCVAGMSTDYLENSFKQIRLSPNQQFAIYKDKNLLFSSITSSVDPSLFLPSDPNNQRMQERNIARLDNQYFIYNSLVHDDGYSIIIQTPLTDIIGNITGGQILYCITICLLLTGITLTIVQIIRKILTALNRLITACNEFELEHTAPVVCQNLPREMQTLFDSFNRMSERISSLVQEVIIKQQKQQETELQFLRTQINPHYLYNTLEIMHMKAYSQNDYDVSAMSELLGRNLQYGLRNTTKEVSLREELEQMNIYLSILSYQYGDRIQTRICFENDLMNCRIIKLVFQPIIENAVIHGITSSDQFLTIDILGYQEENCLIIQISDDGCGMTPHELQELRQTLESTTSKSIGFRNVCRRIQLYYGTEYKTTIDSSYGVGTTVTLRFPWRLIDSEEEC